MRVLTTVETAAIAGGGYTIAVPANDEQFLAAMGIGLGIIGSGAGATFGGLLASSSAGTAGTTIAVVLGGAIGGAFGALAVPYLGTNLANGLVYCYRKMGLI